MLSEPTSPAAETYRILGTNLDFVNLERNARTIMFTRHNAPKASRPRSPTSPSRWHALAAASSSSTSTSAPRRSQASSTSTTAEPA